MEIRIGVQNVAREIVIETDMTADEVSKAVNDAVGGAILDLSDTKGRRLVVPAGALGYVEIGEESKRRVGFGA
ncbi:DUF3107 domain-containing protein [Demequina sp. NBRC 110053]|uniref:DUF3107 domain-containing protein n=1 Tax=Demequina sp. NBRC 110053 TaxID=1570342 RepID=UPI000A004A2D|nr:DUF3107 domain-containing protein [Demequina sp. NBRC 110053]